MNFPYPSITDGTERMQLVQIRQYLYQLADLLNMEKQAISRETASYAVEESIAGAAGKSQTSPVGTFNSIREFIIKSADIVNAYYEQISKRLEGVYAAEATFPGGSASFVEKTSQDITVTSQRTEQLFRDLQNVVSQMESIGNTVVSVTANIRTGLLYYMDQDGTELAPEITVGTPVYGLEVGQENEVNGETTFQRFARFTSFGVLLYDENGNEAAYITNRQLHIPHARVTVTFTEGGFRDEIAADGSVVTRWVGV